MTHEEPNHPYGAYLRAGIAVYNAGFYHPAHDAWERRWLHESGPEADLLQGLIQLAAAVHHAQERNMEGATGLAESAQAYLMEARKGDATRGVNVAAVQDYLARFEQDPTVIERERPVRLEVESEQPSLDTLEFPAAGLAAKALAEDTDHEEPIERGVTHATRDITDGVATSPFVALVLDYLRAQGGGDPETAIVLGRLRDHVNRRERRAGDVTGLFDPDED